MGHYTIKNGIVLIIDGNTDLYILDETGRKKITSPLISALLGLMDKSTGDEDRLVAMLKNRFSPEEVYYGLIQLEKQGIIISDATRPESPADLFRTKAANQKDMGYPRTVSTVIQVKVFAIGGADASANDIATVLGRSELLVVERVTDWRETDSQAVYVAVVPDYLEPELVAFGRQAHETGLRWLPVKPAGVIPWMGPLFVPGETGCVECLLARVRGHRRLEVRQISENERGESLRLSVGQTNHSLEMVSGLLTVELEKCALGSMPEITGTVFTFDCRTIALDRHLLTKRPQCSLCGTSFGQGCGAYAEAEGILKEPLPLQPRMKADYRDGGERICAAMETLEKYTYLVSPVTGIVGRMTTVAGIPSCFGTVMRSDWIVHNAGERDRSEENGRRAVTGVSTGKGRSGPQARASALGEAIERYSSQYEGCEPHIRASFSELGDAAVHPGDLMGFSERQYRERAIWRQKWAVAIVPDPYDANHPIDWTPAWSLTHKKWRFVPSAFVYYSYPREGGGEICHGCSNGVAAGNCLEEAVMQGYYELVERDATAMWWYHRLLKPAVEWRCFDSAFTAAVDAAVNTMNMSMEILDLTNDLGVPVFSANLFDENKDGCFKSIGLGCHIDPRIALERAVAELGQCWRFSEKDKESIAFQKSTHSRELYLRADPRQTPKRPSDFVGEQQADFLDDIENAVQLLRSRGLEMLVVDLTRPDVGFPVARVIVPGMIHFWPRFGCRRLFGVPKAAGWIDGDVSEDDLNPVPFFL